MQTNEMPAYELIQGRIPLLVSIPHMGTFLPPDIKEKLTDEAQKLPDTDWNVDRLYSFAKDMGASILMATHSRYVIDLNRPKDDKNMYPEQVSTSLCPTKTFFNGDIYKDKKPTNDEINERTNKYWNPYHEALQKELNRLKEKFGYVILYDAHSIVSRIEGPPPHLFEGELPGLNLGSNNGKSCAHEMAERALKAASDKGYSTVLNGRFVGGHITRNYGEPDKGVHAIQMELAQKNYMDEKYPYAYDPAKAEKLQTVLKKVLETIVKWGQEQKPCPEFPIRNSPRI